MKRRQFMGGLAGAVAASSAARAAAPATEIPIGAEAFRGLVSGVKVTNMKVFVVSLTPNTDRPFVFVKLETDAGVVGWGDGTLEGKAQVVAACINDFRAFIIGADPMQVEHHWQSLYVHTFHRGGPVISAAISGLDEALWDIRGKILGLPVYKMLGGPYDPQGVRGYIGVGGNPEQLRKLRESNTNLGVTCVKSGLPSYLGWIETHAKIDQAVRQMQGLREALGPDIDIAMDFHGRTSPSVASVIIKAVEPLGLLFVEEPIPPENVKALAKISRRTSTPIATGERAVSHYACRELIEMGVVDVLQPDINHVGGITAMWKVAMMASVSGITISPHAAAGPIGKIASLHVDSAIPNFLVQEGARASGTSILDEWFGFPAMLMVNGKCPLPEKPGLGFELSESVFEKYVINRPALMGRAFLEDGSVAQR